MSLCEREKGKRRINDFMHKVPSGFLLNELGLSVIAHLQGLALYSSN